MPFRSTGEPPANRVRALVYFRAQGVVPRTLSLDYKADAKETLTIDECSTLAARKNRTTPEGETLKSSLDELDLVSLKDYGSAARRLLSQSGTNLRFIFQRYEHGAEIKVDDLLAEIKRAGHSVDAGPLNRLRTTLDSVKKGGLLFRYMEVHEYAQAMLADIKAHQTVHELSHSAGELSIGLGYARMSARKANMYQIV